MRNWIIMSLLLIATVTCAQDSLRQQPTYRVGLNTSFNGVADEAALGIEGFVTRSLLHWKYGSLEAGISTFYGSFPNTSDRINQYTTGKTRLIQPLQLQIEHRFQLLNDLIHLRSAFLVGPSLFQQRLTMDDNRYDLNMSYQYDEWFITGQAQFGIGFNLGKHTVFEAFGNLSAINRKIAPYGVGLGLSRGF